jgi:hypothetical protein
VGGPGIDRRQYSDEPDFDEHWLGMPMDAAGVSLRERRLGDLNEFIRRSGLTPKFEEPPRHRAEADARRLALALNDAFMRPRSEAAETGADSPVKHGRIR